MKFKVKAGELKEALEIAKLTVDKRANSELGYVYIGAKKDTKGERLLLHSTDSISRTLLKVTAVVEDPGELIIEPIRLSYLLDKQAEDADVSFSNDGKGNRIAIKVAGARGSLSSAHSKIDTYRPDLSKLPVAAKADFKIEADNLKRLIERTQPFIYREEGKEHFKTLLIRSIPGGYEALASNAAVVAKAKVEDENSPAEGQPEAKIEIPGRALASLLRMLGRASKEKIKIVLQRNDTGAVSWAFFQTANIFFGTGVASVSLPAVDIVFDKNDMTSSIYVPREAMLNSIHRSDPFCQATDKGYRLINLGIKGKTLKLKASDGAGSFEEDVPTLTDAVGEGSGTFHVSFLSEILRHSNLADVTLKIGTAGPCNAPSAMILAGENNGATYVVGAV